MDYSKTKSYRDSLIERAKKTPNIANFELQEKDIIENLMNINKIFKVEDECKNSTDQTKCGSDGYHFRLIKDEFSKTQLQPYICPKIKLNKPFLINQNYVYTSLDLSNHNQLLNKNSIRLDEYETDAERIKFINYLIKLKKGVTTPQGLYVWGENGTGKTFLLLALCNELALLNKKIIYLVLNNFCLEIIQGIKQQKDMSDLIDELKYVDVLVLDELGNEEYSNYVHNSILYPVLNYRLNTNKLTIFGSKNNLNELKSFYEIAKTSKNIDNFINRIENLVGKNIFHLKVKYG